MILRYRYTSLMVVLMAGVTLVAALYATEPIQPIPTDLRIDRAKALLGKKLFSDPRMSRDNSVSCETCHDLSEAGAEFTRVSTGIDGKTGTRNSPTVFNSYFNFRQFWDGRAADLVHQSSFPVTDPVEMGMATWDDATRKLAQTAEYPPLFNRLFDDGVTTENIQLALAEFEKTLILPNSRFDRFLRGDTSAIDEQQKRGYALFKAYGCASCHQGVNVGGNMFQKFGVLKDINLNDSINDDLGRYNITRNEWEKRYFKVPSLRLAVRTPPYFHDGSAATIEEAVDVMIEFQLGREVPSTDRDDIIAFLETLVGEYQEIK